MPWFSSATPKIVRGSLASTETTLVVSALSVLFAVGLDWGLPGPGWALDEMGADAVLAGLYRGFANGWADQYPPLHYYLLTLVYAPILLIEKLGLFSASWIAVKFLLLLHTRLLSLVMAIGTAVVMGLAGDRLLGRRSGRRRLCLYGWHQQAADQQGSEKGLSASGGSVHET